MVVGLEDAIERHELDEVERDDAGKVEHPRKDGRPADGFQGALGEAEIVAFLERHGGVKLSGDDAEDDEPALDPDSPEARLERARVAAAAGEAAGTAVGASLAVAAPTAAQGCPRGARPAARRPARPRCWSKVNLLRSHRWSVDKWVENRIQERFNSETQECSQEWFTIVWLVHNSCSTIVVGETRVLMC